MHEEKDHGSAAYGKDQNEIVNNFLKFHKK